VAYKEIGLEVNADKYKYMVMSRDQTAGRSHSMKIGNSSFEMVKECKYLGEILTNQNSIQEEIRNRLKSGNACYHSVHNLLPDVLYGCETWSLTSREKYRMGLFLIGC
jgi:hypothetical protein